MRLDARKRAYFLVRGAAAVVFVLAATVLPRGVPAALLVVGAGLVAVMTCVATNAGSRGEQVGAREQNRAFDRMRAPQGDWPPYVPEQSTESRLVPRER